MSARIIQLYLGTTIQMVNLVPVGKTRHRVGGRNIFYLVLDMKDIYKEADKLAVAIQRDLLIEAESHKPVEKIQAGERARVKSVYTSSSNRVKTVLSAITKSDKFKNYTLGPKPVTMFRRHGIKSVIMRTGNINRMDSMTNLSVLDSKFRQYHNTSGFATAPSKKITIKKIGQTSKLNPKYSLWRLFEFGKRAQYQISSPTAMRYTTVNDGFSRWHYSHAVTWVARDQRKAAGIYFMLDTNRKIYKQDKYIFKESVINGVRSVIAKKTRFR